ncbi:hypothetical protein CPB84DRAFT_1823433 [Gymnopilus junonius]|uniref:Uncharacterized protein n=1 Tax=Gymnopilus junonius TaxID=109634 RepID=A0A9P5NSF4_GYMJU|nr:hypothetical protein CPB84DRAFT_1823433 [Gymnopilus junonius]
MPRMHSTSTTVQTDQPALQRPRSKSRTIIRMISTKFTRVTNSPPALAKPPPAAPTGWSKDQRDAALRERGLLPPLRPNKDLSLQESELDQLIPVVEPEEESQDKPSGPSAADLIKKEWEPKTRPLRSNSGSAWSISTVPPTIDKPTPPPNEPLPPVPTLSPESVHQDYPPRSSSVNVLAVPPSQSETKVRPLPSPPLAKVAPSEIEAWTVPLPPSPSPSVAELPSPPQPATSPVPSQSRSLPSIPDTSQSAESSACGSGANTPRPLDQSKTFIPTQPTTPVISLTPATEIPSPSTEPTTPSAGADDRLGSALHNRTDSFAQLEDSISSIATPSLDSTSNTTNSTTGTSDASSHISNAIKGPGKLGMLQVKTLQEVASTVPVIIESPVQMTRFSEELEVVMEESPSMDFGIINEKSEKPAISTPLVPPRSPPAPTSVGTTLRPQRRGVTDPVVSMDRRKSFNPFKRGQTMDVSPIPEPQRRLSMARSLSNLRRSVVGTLSHKPTKGAEGEGGRVEKNFDASHLPASPTIPQAFARPRPSDVSKSSAGSPPPTPGMRQAVAPIIYNRGSILLETAGIEDEETRRMTELAFLG